MVDIEDAGHLETNQEEPDYRLKTLTSRQDYRKDGHWKFKLACRIS